ncbi:hypothetical protein ZYGR_0AS01060 [Zygosaccharomyces rouxii]|uniref:VASt domain-containing protein n=1 Tax=Zygosaccharomyces rouxii TaxID=4956 RepID=A0A1Q3AH35_ZYGRO|nr:hypothetical protein ZYGR_0AS01060 [Zygosaccharomyces rouxii]
MSLLPSVDLKGSTGSGSSNDINVEDTDATLRRKSINTNDRRESLTVGSSNGSNNSSVHHKHGKSSSSLDVTVPVNMKSTPADPHLSDVNSVSSHTSVNESTTALDSVNDIIEKNVVERNPDKEAQIPASGDASDKNDASNGNGTSNGNTRFFENMISSFSFKSAPQNPPPLQTQVNNNQPEEISSPNIISHRRHVSSQKKNGKRVASPVVGLGSPTSSSANESEKPKELPGKTQLEEFNNYDTTKFVDETYLDTPFHYAVMGRNAEFHSLFKNVPKDDKLLDDFSCALSREFLYQGRLYISESHVCFYSSLLGWIAKVIIPFKDITFIEKTSTAGLFQNAVSIETATGKTQFNGFISRDIAFTLLKEVWARTLLAEGDKQSAQERTRSASGSFSQDQHLPLHSGSFSDSKRPSGPPSRASYVSENDAVIEDAIRSVDDVTPTHSEDEADGELRSESIALEEDNEDYASDNESEKKSAVVSEGSKMTKAARCYKFKPEVHYSYDGPLRGTPTKYKYSPEDNKEFVLAEVELNAPPGVVFQILFGNNPSFWIEFFISQDSSKFTDFGEFDKINEDGKKYRDFSYAKGLHFPVGPKSTKCVVSEQILECDYSDFIHVLNTTRTPDVPSGGSFATKTRYMFRWASKTTCMLKVSYFIDWSASSWIKSMVESGARSGQISATKDLLKQIQQYLDTYVMETTINVSAGKNYKKSIRQSTSPAAVAMATSKPTTEARELKEAVTKNTHQLDTTKHTTNQLLFIVIIALLFLIYNEVKLRGEIRELKTLFVQPSLDQKGLKETVKNQILAEIKNELSNL